MKNSKFTLKRYLTILNNFLFKIELYQEFYNNRDIFILRE